MKKNGRLSFESVKVTIDCFGKKIDAKQWLRGFEAKLRDRTGLPQITAEFMTQVLSSEAVVIEYSLEFGYWILVQSTVIFSGGGRQVEDLAVRFIAEYSQQHKVVPCPPPIPRTTPCIEQAINFDTETNHYEALAHDGGCLVVFYKRKANDAGVLLRHIIPRWVVHYEFESIQDYHELFNDAKRHCSAFLDLSFLGSEPLSQDTIRVFMHEHQLYGM